MEHPGIQAGSVPAGLAPSSLPLDTGHVNHDPHIAAVGVITDVRLLLCHHHGSLEEIFTSKERNVKGVVDVSDLTPRMCRPRSADRSPCHHK